MSWVYIISTLEKGNVYAVGFFDLHGTWHADSNWGTQEQAANRVHYLNGGAR